MYKRNTYVHESGEDLSSKYGSNQVPTSLGIQIRNSKIDLNLVALSIGCRNKH